MSQTPIVRFTVGVTTQTNMAAATSTSPTIGVETFANVTASLHAGKGCLGAPLASGLTDAAGFRSFGAVPVTANAVTRFSVKVTTICRDATYRHDNLAPGTPLLTSIERRASDWVVRGWAEPLGMVSVYSNNRCTTQIGAASKALGGRFSSILTAAPPATVYLDVVDQAGNRSSCAAVPVVAIPSLGEEKEQAACPALPNEAPSMPPLHYSADNGTFRAWKNDACDTGTCLLQGPMERRYFEVFEDRPALLGTQSSVSMMPLIGYLGVAAEDPSDPITRVYGTDGAGHFPTIHASGLPTIIELTARKNALVSHNQMKQRDTLDFPYTDLGTRLIGNPLVDGHGPFLFWNFMESWNTYAAAFSLGPPPVDFDPPGQPFDGWRRAWWDPAFVNSTDDAGVVIRTSPPGYENAYAIGVIPLEYRYGVDLTAPGWVAWERNVIKQAALSGYPATFLDNASASATYNAHAKADFEVWAQAQAFPQALLERAHPSMLPDSACEDWQYDCLYVDNAPEAVGPSIDALRGTYSAVVQASAVGRTVKFNWSKGAAPAFLPSKTYSFRFGFKASAGAVITSTAPCQLSVVGTGSWATSPSCVVSNTSGPAQVSLTTPPNTEVRFDELELTPLNPRDSFTHDDYCLGPGITSSWDAASLSWKVTSVPQWPTKLPIGMETASSVAPDCTMARLTARRWYLDQLAGKTTETLRSAGREVAPRFDFFANSKKPIKGASWFMSENGGDWRIFEAVGRPGVYPTTTVFEGAAPIPNSQLITSAFHFRHLHDLRGASSSRPIMHRYGMSATINDGGLHLDYDNPDTMLLDLAQTAAFGGGLGYDSSLFAFSAQNDVLDGGRVFCETSAGNCLGVVDARRNSYRDRLRPFFDTFINKNPSLFTCKRFHADILMRLSEDNYVATEQVAVFNELTARGYLVDVTTNLTSAEVYRSKIVVLDRVARLSEAEAGTLMGFKGAGGAVIATQWANQYFAQGSTGAKYPPGFRDELGRRRDAFVSLWPLRSQDGVSPQAPLSATKPVECSNGTAPCFWYVEGDLPGAAFAEKVADLASSRLGYGSPFTTLTPAQSARLRVAAWTPNGGLGPQTASLTVHVLNYDVARGYWLPSAPPGQNSPALTRIAQSFKVAVRVPPASPAPTQARIYRAEAPLAAPVTVPVVLRADGRVEFEVPNGMDIYLIADLF